MHSISAEVLYKIKFSFCEFVNYNTFVGFQIISNNTNQCSQSIYHSLLFTVHVFSWWLKHSYLQKYYRERETM